MEDQSIGYFVRLALNTSISLRQGESNWLFASMPTPNVKEYWLINAVLLRYRIIVNSEFGIGGKIDKIGLMDGNNKIYEFANLDLGATNDWQTSRLEIQGGAHSFYYGLGLSIHVDFPEGPIGPGPTKFSFASVGLEFVKTV